MEKRGKKEAVSIFDKPAANAALLLRLESFLKKGFRDPVKTLQFLRSKGRCDKCLSRCDMLMNYSDGQIIYAYYRKFFEWVGQWYPSTKEEPLDAVITIPLIMQFLISETAADEASLGRIFRMEFKGKVKDKEHLRPPCIWVGMVGAGSCITLAGRNQKCCDFLLLPPFPNSVVEVKLAPPKPASETSFSSVKNNIEKCESWLERDKEALIKRDFGIDRLDCALSLLIDLTETARLRNEWSDNVKEQYYASRNILAWHISP